MSWQQWQEILNWSTPLAGLVLIAVSIYRGIRWIASKFIEPFGGPDGIIAKYLEAQQEEHRKQTLHLLELQNAFLSQGVATKRQLESLMDCHHSHHEELADCHTKITDLLRIQRHLADAVGELRDSSGTTHRLDEHLQSIKLIVNKYT
jgi:predicted nuclease with TOPRIM domain